MSTVKRGVFYASVRVGLSPPSGWRRGLISLLLVFSTEAQVKSGIEQLARQSGVASEAVHNQWDGDPLRLFDFEQKVESTHTMQDDGA